MKNMFFVAFLAGFIAIGSAQAVELNKELNKPALENVAEFPSRVGNLAVAANGEVIVTMHPFDNPKTKLMILSKDGKAEPFPNAVWSAYPDSKGRGITNAIGIRATLDGQVIVLDLGDSKHEPRFVFFDVATRAANKIITIPKYLLTEQSFLQDFAYDWSKSILVIADIGQADLTKPAKPALIVINPDTGFGWRLLEGHKSLLPNGRAMMAEDKKVLAMKDGKPVEIHNGLNPITIDPQREWLYFGPMGQGLISRIPVMALFNPDASNAELEKSIQTVGQKDETDGMTIDSAGNIYLTSSNGRQIEVMNDKGERRSYIKDDRLIWPDGFSFGVDGYVYVTVNQLNRAAALNGGKEEGKPPYAVMRFKPIAEGSVGR